MILEKIVNTENRKVTDIKKLLESTLPLVIYGAGSYATDVTKLLKKYCVKIDAACVDTEYFKSDECSFDGIKVNTIENICKQYEHFNVVIGFADYKQARIKLRNIQGITEIIFIDAPHSLEFFDYHYIVDHLKDFEFTYNLFYDKLSKDTFIAYINAKISGQSAGLYELVDRNQYFNDLVPLGKQETFIDCGAYDGDTILEFYKKTNGEYKEIYAFEPDGNNYLKLQRVINENEIKHVHTIKKGCWDGKTTLQFSSDANMASIVSNEGDFTIDVDAIDNAVDQKKVTFIKMDIEGSELPALRGAEKTIKESKPKLAICIYHKPEDLITIPQFISSIVPDYKFFLRHH